MVPRHHHPKSITPISHEQVEQAMAYFRAHGGIIHVLPDERIADAAPVNSRDGSAYRGLLRVIPPMEWMPEAR